MTTRPRAPQATRAAPGPRSPRDLGEEGGEGGRRGQRPRLAPHMAHDRKISRPKGSSGDEAVPRVLQEVGPSMRMSRAQPSSVSSISGVPPRRRASSAMPATAPALTASVAMFMLADMPPVTQ